MASEVRNGLCFKHNGVIHIVVSFQHVKQARSAAFLRVKIRNIKTGKIVEETFNGGHKFDDIRVEHRTYQYLYAMGDDLVLMDSTTGDQIEVDKNTVDGVDFLLEGQDVKVLWNDADSVPITIEVPESVIQEVTYTEPGLKGDTATNASKPATLESGAEVKVPLFINIGDVIKVDTSIRSYMERVKS